MTQSAALIDLVIQAPSLTRATREAFVALAPHAPCLHQPHAMRLKQLEATPALRAAALQLGAQLGCDVALVPEHLTTPYLRVLVMDMDSTVITMECIDELAELAGQGKQVAAITEAAMRGEITDFADSLRRRVALLAGAPASIIDTVLQERLAYTHGAQDLLTRARQAGWYSVLVSGGFHAFADVVGNHLGFDKICANELLIRDGLFTGHVRGGVHSQGAIVDGQCKADQLRLACQKLGCQTDQALAIGDGANDLLMMAAAGWSVAYRAKPRVKEKAACFLDTMGLDGVMPLFHDTWAS